MGWISDEPMIYEKLTPFEYLEFVTGLWGIGAAEAERSAQELFGWLGLAEHAHERCEGFSKCMRRPGETYAVSPAAHIVAHGNVCGGVFFDRLGGDGGARGLRIMGGIDRCRPHARGARGRALREPASGNNLTGDHHSPPGPRKMARSASCEIPPTKGRPSSSVWPIME
jgi:hypothetical protein